MDLKFCQIQLDFRSKQPVFEQIADGIRAAIQSGECQPGDQLPTVRQMADALKINFNTVARAYRVLDFEGWLSTQRGRGTYVIEPNFGKPEEDVQQPESLDRLLSTIKNLIETSRLPYDLILQNLLAAIKTEQSKGISGGHPIYQPGTKVKHTAKRANKKAVSSPHANQRKGIRKKNSIKSGHSY